MRCVPSVPCELRTALRPLPSPLSFHENEIHAFYTFLIHTQAPWRRRRRPNAHRRRLHRNGISHSCAIPYACIATLATVMSEGGRHVAEVKYFMRNFYDVVDKFYCRQFLIYFAETTIKIWKLINGPGLPSPPHSHSAFCPAAFESAKPDAARCTNTRTSAAIRILRHERQWWAISNMPKRISIRNRRSLANRLPNTHFFFLPYLAAVSILFLISFSNATRPASVCVCAHRCAPLTTKA